MLKLVKLQHQYVSLLIHVLGIFSIFLYVQDYWLQSEEWDLPYHFEVFLVILTTKYSKSRMWMSTPTLM